jgi:Glycosyl transferase family 2
MTVAIATICITVVQVVGVPLRIQADARAYTMWLQLCAGSAEVSIVVPVLNEETNVKNICGHLQQLQPPPREVIFVDGGSTDRRAPALQLVAALRLCMHCGAYITPTQIASDCKPQT